MGHSLSSSDVRIKMSEEMFTGTFLCFFLGRTSPAALNLKSTAPWCSETFGSGSGLMIRITRYWHLCKLGGVREGSSVRKPQDKQREVSPVLVLCLPALFLSSQATFYHVDGLLGGALEMLLRIPYRLRLLSLGGRAVGGKGVNGSCFILV